MLTGQDLNITNNGRRNITLPQVNGRPVTIAPLATKRVRVFSRNSNNIRKWAYVGMITLAPYTAPVVPPPVTP